MGPNALIMFALNEIFQRSTTFFNGVYMDRRFGKTVFNLPGTLEDNYLHGLTLSWHLSRFWKDFFAVEAEAMAAHHHGRHREGSQSYQEHVAALFLRYDRFPWNHSLHTSIALISFSDFLFFFFVLFGLIFAYIQFYIIPCPLI